MRWENWRKDGPKQEHDQGSSTDSCSAATCTQRFETYSEIVYGSLTRSRAHGLSTSAVLIMSSDASRSEDCPEQGPSRGALVQICVKADQDEAHVFNNGLRASSVMKCQSSADQNRGRLPLIRCGKPAAKPSMRSPHQGDNDHDGRNGRLTSRACSSTIVSNDERLDADILLTIRPETRSSLTCQRR